jgi:hypothetical protein
MSVHAINDAKCGFVQKFEVFTDTPFYFACDMRDRGLPKNKLFLDILRDKDLYHQYYASQNAKHKETLDKALDVCTSLFWKQIGIAVHWFSILKLVNKVVSSNSFLMSLFPPPPSYKP